MELDTPKTIGIDMDLDNPGPTEPHQEQVQPKSLKPHHLQIVPRIVNQQALVDKQDAQLNLAGQPRIGVIDPTIQDFLRRRDYRLQPYGRAQTLQATNTSCFANQTNRMIKTSPHTPQTGRQNSAEGAAPPPTPTPQNHSSPSHISLDHQTLSHSSSDHIHTDYTALAQHRWPTTSQTSAMPPRQDALPPGNETRDATPIEEVVNPNGAKQGTPPVHLSNEQFTLLFGHMINMNQNQNHGAKPRDNWKLTHIGVFNPRATAQTSGDTVTWTDVDNFVESIRDNASTPERIEQIRTNLPQLLRGAALDWWVSVVQPAEKDMIKTSIQNWVNALQRQFRLDRTNAIAKLDILRYTAQNCRDNIDIKKWAMSFFQIAQAAGFQTVEQQLSQLYLHVDPSLHELILKPTQNMSIQMYLEHLHEKQQARTAALTSQTHILPNTMDLNTQMLHHPKQLTLPAAGAFVQATPDQDNQQAGYWYGQSRNN